MEKDGVTQKAQIDCNLQDITLTFHAEEGAKTYTGVDFFECFGMLRADYPNIKFLCKGAKLNVYPSTMSSQMSAGLVAYEVKMGQRTGTENIVRIFDYEDTDITNDINKQREFYYEWYESVTGISRSSYIGK